MRCPFVIAVLTCVWVGQVALAGRISVDSAFDSLAREGAPAILPPPPDATEFGDYVIIHRDWKDIMSGSEGRIFKCYEKGIGSVATGPFFAMKLFKQDNGYDAAKELEPMKRLSSAGVKNIPPVLAYGNHPTFKDWFVMPLYSMDLNSFKWVLKSPLQGGKATPRDVKQYVMTVLRIAEKVSAAIAGAVAIGTIHRDLKSMNIFVSVAEGATEPTDVVLGDWGFSVDASPELEDGVSEFQLEAATNRPDTIVEHRYYPPEYNTGKNHVVQIDKFDVFGLHYLILDDFAEKIGALGDAGNAYMAELFQPIVGGDQQWRSYATQPSILEFQGMIRTALTEIERSDTPSRFPGEKKPSLLDRLVGKL